MMGLGSKIKELRKAKKMKLKELSEATGVALATLSRIENNKMSGTIKSHMAIASALGMDLPQLYSNIEEAQSPVDFQPKESRTETFVHNNMASYDILTGNVLSKKMMPVMLKISPGAKTSNEELPKQTEKFLYILKGRCKACIGGEEYTLNEAETLYFDASLKHYFENIGNAEVRAVCVITPPAL